MEIKRVFIIIILSLSLFSCSLAKKAKLEDQKIQSDKELFDHGMQNVKNRKYKKSVELFSKLGQEYPYSKYAQKAQLMEAYSYYRLKKYEHAVAGLDEYIKLYPSAGNIPYAYYLKSLCYYDQILSVKLDQTNTEKSDTSLTEVVNRFPASQYAKDAKVKLDFVKDRLAGKEMEIGRFYFKKGNILSGLNRFQDVVKKFENTIHVQEALYRLTEGYYILGVKDEAKRNAAVLGYNYPYSKWYRYSYNLLK